LSFVCLWIGYSRLGEDKLAIFNVGDRDEFVILYIPWHSEYDCNNVVDDEAIETTERVARDTVNGALTDFVLHYGTSAYTVEEILIARSQFSETIISENFINIII